MSNPFKPPKRSEMAEAGGGGATVKSIFVYPIKSCRGISVSQAPLTSTGLRWDRLWMIVNSKGRMLTQRVEPKLALIQVDLPIQAFSPPWEPDTTSFLVINAPGMNASLKIPMVEPPAIANGVTVWNWTGPAFDEGDEAANWFSHFLGRPSRLVRFNEASECCRPAMSDYAKSYPIKFNDWYPFHLISQESLNALNDRLSEPISINRFRANFVVDGCEPFSEDLWNEIKINDFTFRGGELCYRCKIPTINQETAAPGSEPSQTLVSFRSDKVLLPNNEKHRGRVYMGQMLVCTNFRAEESKERGIRVGDGVHVLKSVSSYDHCIL